MIFEKAQAQTLLNLCEQAYVLANTGHCTLPDGFSDPVAIRLPVEGRPLLLKNDNLDIFGFVTLKEGVANIVFRGTQILSGFDFAAEWALDALSLPLVKFGFGNVHLGFYEAWRSLRAAVIDSLVKLAVPVEVPSKAVIIGHSLGAALATLCWADFGGDLLTFASPRVGDPDFAKALWDKQTVRIINEPDLVPRVPTDPPFRHGGQEIVVQGPGSPTDLKLAHRLESYCSGLNLLP